MLGVRYKFGTFLVEKGSPNRCDQIVLRQSYESGRRRGFGPTWPHGTCHDIMYHTVEYEGFVPAKFGG